MTPEETEVKPAFRPRPLKHATDVTRDLQEQRARKFSVLYLHPMYRSMSRVALSHRFCYFPLLFPVFTQVDVRVPDSWRFVVCRSHDEWARFSWIYNTATYQWYHRKRILTWTIFLFLLSPKMWRRDEKNQQLEITVMRCRLWRFHAEYS